jgi:NAD-dependent deacetylase
MLHAVDFCRRFRTSFYARRMSSIDEAIRAIREARPRNVVVMTGAGVSADSGIPTFRGPGGLWRDFRAEDLATPEAFRRDPRLVWEWYEWRRGLIREARPNAAHEALARLDDAVVVTQNVDGLHVRAGSRDVVELHGNIFRVRCVREGTSQMHEEPFAELPPHCETCGALLRPGVVWFGEMLPDDAVARAVGAIHNADILLVIGTSGVVYPAAGFVTLHQGLSIEINPETSRVSSSCTLAIPARAAEATPAIVEALLEVRS